MQTESASTMRNQYSSTTSWKSFKYQSHSFHTFFLSWQKTITNSRYCTFVFEWSLALTAGVMQLSSKAQWDNCRGGGIHKFWQDSLDVITPPDHLPSWPSWEERGRAQSVLFGAAYSIKYIMSRSLPLITSFSAFSFTVAQWTKTHPKSSKSNLSILGWENGSSLTIYSLMVPTVIITSRRKQSLKSSFLSPSCGQKRWLRVHPVGWHCDAGTE